MKSFESGIDIGYILCYLRDELALDTMHRADSFRYKKAVVSVTPLPPRKLGSFSIQRNKLELWGNEADIEEFEHAFLMRFLSAGG